MAAKSRPLTIRLAAPTYAYVVDEAERTGRARGAVVEALAEESVRMRLFPGIGFKEGDPRRAWVMGTGLDVWQVIEAVQQDGSSESLVANYEIDEQHVRLALAYYERYPEEIDRFLVANRRTVAELKELYPMFEFSGVDE